MAKPLRVLLADDHATVRQGLKLLIDSQPDMGVVGEVADGTGVVQQAASSNPDVVIKDVSMPGTNGLIATRALKRAQPDVAIVALTRHNDDGWLEELFRAGASGYVLKQSAPFEFLQAIRAVAAGGVYLDAALAPRVANGLLAATPPINRQTPKAISERESEVLRLIAVGHSNREVAAHMNLSVKTVEVHKANAMRKLRLTGRVEIIRYAVLQGWLYDT